MRGVIVGFGILEDGDLEALEEYWAERYEEEYLSE